jgi:replicative DNA helicase
MSNFLPPHNIDIEYSVLIGAIMYGNIVAEKVATTCTPEWYFTPKHAEIFKAVKHVYSKTNSCDYTSVVDELKRAGKFDSIEEGYLFPDSKVGSYETNIDYHLEILRGSAIKRNLIQTATASSAMAYDGDKDAYECLDALSKALTGLQDGEVATHTMSVSEIIEAERTKPKAEIMTLGIDVLDNGIYAHNGRHKGQYEVTMAESKHGKTVYAMFKTILLARNGYKTHWFQLEDYGYNTAKVFADVLGPTFCDNIVITDSIYDIERIKREARIYKKDFQTDNIVIDYIQNVEASKNTRTEVTELASTEIRKMAIELNVMCHATSQITIVDQRRKGWGLFPRANDVRWSKQIKQDTHIMTAVFRPYMVDGLNENDIATDWKNNEIPKTSLYFGGVHFRYGQPDLSKVHFLHTDNGLVMYDDWVRENEARNNAHRNVIVPTLPEDEDAPF